MKYHVYNESGKWLLSTTSLGLNWFLGLRKEAIQRCEKLPVCELHISRGQFEGRILTVRHIEL